MEKSVGALRKGLSGGEVLYGVNTGFGKLASTRIPPEKCWRSSSST
jgi:histidine ammonia-lyase